MDASPLRCRAERGPRWTLVGRRHQGAEGEDSGVFPGQRRVRDDDWQNGRRRGYGEASVQLHWVDMETGEIVDLKLTRARFLITSPTAYRA